MEHLLSAFKDRVATASVERTPLRIRGGGSKDWYGRAPIGAQFDTRAYAGIVDYEPTELVITVRCGTPLREVVETLAAHRQMLAFDPPAFGPDATIGGVVAAGLSGPARASVGALRDFVLGAVLMDGQGQVLHFGGQVMKNVAGYDVSRLLAGSLGILGLILEVSLKVLPQPITETTMQLPMPQAEAIAQLNRWSGQPMPIVASLWQDDQLMLRLAGAQAAVQSAARAIGAIGGIEIDGAPVWPAVREQQLPYFDGIDATHPLWRLSVPSATPPLQLPGPQLIEWGGAQRWWRGDAGGNAATAEIRAQASAAGGHATLFRGGDKAAGVFQPLTPAVDKIHRRLKLAFDPQGIFNPGRMIADL